MRLLLAIPDGFDPLVDGGDSLLPGLFADWPQFQFHRASFPGEAEHLLSSQSDFAALVLCLPPNSLEVALQWQVLAESSGLPTILIGANAASLAGATNIIRPDIGLIPGNPKAVHTLLDTLGGMGLNAIRLKNSFLAALSHELRTPLNAIIGFSDIMLLDGFGEIDPAQIQEYVTAINKSGKTLLRTIEDLQELAAAGGMASCQDNGCRDLIDLVPDLVCLCRDNKIISVNAAGAILLGPTTPDRLIGRDFRSFVQSGDILERDIAELSGHSLRIPLTIRNLGGEIRHMEAAATLLPSGKSGPVVLLLARDVSDSVRQAELVRNYDDAFHRTINSVGDAILLLDETGSITDANSAATDLFGYDREILLQRPLSSLFVSGETHFRFQALPYASLPPQAEGVKSNGKRFSARLAYSRIPFGTQERLLAIVRDTDNEDRLHLLAYRDQKTGLPNKAFLLEHVEHLTSRLEGDNFAVVLADIDHYKTICGLHGEEFGAEIVAKLAHGLKPFESERVFVAKSGNDEFTLVFDGAWSIEHLPLAQLQEIIRAPRRHNGFQVQLTAALGISIYPEDGLDGETLLRHAAAAVRFAKDEPGRSPQRFTPAVSSHLRERSLLEQGVRLAAKRGELTVVYQPKVDLTTGMVVGAEALVRWNSPELGMVSPAAFIPVAEWGGAIVEIGDWVFDEVCREMGPYLCGEKNFRVSVNLSPRQFLQPRLAKKLRRAMERFGISGRSMDIEVTEGMLLGGDEIIQRNMADLKNIDLTISLDDFGTCYSSLAYLSRFPLDAIKIDKAFIQGVPEDRGNVAITTAIIAMARGLGFGLVAEGIETVEQRDFLLDHDCRIAQGYLFGRPAPLAEFPWNRGHIPC